MARPSPLPPPVTIERLFTLWNFDLLWILVCGFGIFFYVAAVLRLRRRGDTWPVLRTVLWIAGMLLLFYITNGGINVYEKFLFSQHMLAHMVLGMGIPVLLVPGAPITLALRTIEKRTDGSRGVREWLLLLVHSKYFEVLGKPLVGAVLFAGSLWVFYYTPLFGWATTNHIGHEWMVIHFLLTGYLFVQALIGVDPSPSRAPYPIRLLILLGTMAFHAFFGLALMSGTGLLLADWYGSMGWDTGITALQDQQRRRDPDCRTGNSGGDHVVAQRCQGVEALRPQGRPRWRRGARRIQCDARGACSRRRHPRSDA